MTNLLLYLFYGLFILLVVAILFLIFKGLHRGFANMGVAKVKSDQLIFYVLLGLVIWLLLLGGLSFIGFFSDFQSLPPRIALAVVPPLILALILTFSKTFTRLLLHIPPAWLINVQSFRILVEIILWIGLLVNIVPFQMTFEGFNYDILVGITALMAAPLFFGKGRFRRFEGIIWNISGLTLLINIIFISIISTPSPLRVFFNEPANTFIAHIPFIWLPGFVVPFALALHLFSIRQLSVLKK